MNTTFKCPRCGEAIPASAVTFGNSARCPACYEFAPVPGTAAFGPEPPGALSSWRTPLLLAIAAITFTLAAAGAVVVVKWRASEENAAAPNDSPDKKGNDAAADLRNASGPPALLVHPTGDDAAAALRYLPDNSKVVMSLDVAGLLGSGVYKEIAPRFDAHIKDSEKKMLDMAGLTLADVSRVIVGGDPTSAQERFVVVTELNKAVGKEKLLHGLDAGKWTEEIVGKGAVHISDGGKAVHFADDRTVVWGTPRDLRAVLSRNGPVQFSEPMAGAIKQLDFSQTLAAVIVVPQNLPDVAASRQVPLEILKQLGAATFHVKVGADVRILAAVVCKADEPAEDLRKMADALIVLAKQMQDVPKEVKEILDSVQVTRSARNVSVGAAIPGELVGKALVKAIETAEAAQSRMGRMKPRSPEKTPRPEEKQ